MSEELVYGIKLSPSTSEEDINTLISSLRLKAFSVQKESERSIGLVELALIITIANNAVNLTEKVIKASKVIIQWRKNLKQKGKEVKGQLENSNKASLDLEIASDEEIRKWFQP